MQWSLQFNITLFHVESHYKSCLTYYHYFISVCLRRMRHDRIYVLSQWCAYVFIINNVYLNFMAYVTIWFISLRNRALYLKAQYQEISNSIMSSGTRRDTTRCPIEIWIAHRSGIKPKAQIQGCCNLGNSYVCSELWNRCFQSSSKVTNKMHITSMLPPDTMKCHIIVNSPFVLLFLFYL